MRTYKYHINDSVRQYSQNNDIVSILCSKQWFVVNNDEAQEVLVFLPNGKLILSINGDTQNLNWQFWNQNKTILINLTTEKGLLFFIDFYYEHIILALRKQGTEEYLFLIDSVSAYAKELTPLSNIQVIFDGIEVRERDKKSAELARKQQEERRRRQEEEKAAIERMKIEQAKKKEEEERQQKWEYEHSLPRLNEKIHHWEQHLSKLYHLRNQAQTELNTIGQEKTEYEEMFQKDKRIKVAKRVCRLYRSAKIWLISLLFVLIGLVICLQLSNLPDVDINGTTDYFVFRIACAICLLLCFSPTIFELLFLGRIEKFYDEHEKRLKSLDEHYRWQDNKLQMINNNIQTDEKILNDLRGDLRQYKTL